MTPLEPDDRQTTVSRPDVDDRATSYVPPVPAQDDRQTIVSRLDSDDRATSYMPPAPPSDDRLTMAPPSPLTPIAEAAAPGATVLRGQYRLDTRLRGGAQAMAFRGTRLLDGAAVFIKVQPNPTGRDGVFAKQIGLRDKLLAIRHPNLLRCLDLGLENEALCEIYEWLEGRELTALLGDAREEFAEARLRDMVSQLAEAIHTLHSATSLSHRDLKPDNVRVIERNGRETFVIVDYGTVSQLDTGGATTVAGTRVYSPPEFYQRRIPNDPLLSTWDWWSLGRIVQEAIDRIHPYDRLSRLFAADLQSGEHGADARVAVELMFDTIMLENDRAHYGVRAGMVEWTEAGGRMPAWLPLLRGLLTSRRRSRWGYGEVVRFLRGEKVPDSYGAAADVEGFEFEHYMLTLPELAQKLMAESSPDKPGGELRWAEAVEIVYRGRLARYVSQILRDAVLLEDLQDCQRVEDRDLGTALALSAISERAIPPAVRGVQINGRFLLAEAARLPDEVPPPPRVKTLMSGGFHQRLKRWHPANAAELEQEVVQVGELVAACRKLGVKADLFGMGTVLRVLHTPTEDLVAMVVEARKKLFQSDVEAIDAAFHEPHLDRMPPFELRALALSLLQPAKHGFMTHGDRESQLKRSVESLNKAVALLDAARLLHPVLAVFHGRFKALAWWSGLAAAGWIYYVATRNTVREPGFEYGPKWFLIISAGAAAGLLYASVRFLWMRRMRQFAAQFTELTQGQAITATLLRNLGHRISGSNARSELARLEAEIAANPHIDRAAFRVAPAGTAALRQPMWIQLGLVAGLLLGGTWYGPWFMYQRPAPSFRVPAAPASKSSKRTPKAKQPVLPTGPRFQPRPGTSPEQQRIYDEAEKEYWRQVKREEDEAKKKARP